MYHKALESEEIRNIYTALGVTIGTEEDSKAANIEKLRYKNHHHDRCRRRWFSHRHIDHDFLLPLYARNHSERIPIHRYSPLYLCKKGKTEEYCWTDAQRQKFIETYGGGEEKAVHTQRYKGLGDERSTALETTMDPENRMLKQVNIEKC